MSKISNAGVEQSETPGKTQPGIANLPLRYHISWGTYGSWLPGDPRGFRTRSHRQHIDGDYRNPPPTGKYAALHAYARDALKKPPVTIEADLQQIVALACLEQFAKEAADVSAISVDCWHVHVAVVCPAAGIKQMIGRVKKVSSHRVRRRIPGRLWQAGCHIVPIRNEEHWRNVLAYIAAHGRKGWAWRKA